ncbi:hypothetical protein [Bacillus sp. FJAT-44742]|uniref:hypothetical protein n=1 Tax=Bacillus sp. FJAT-44742 TaxID=2014005 RepID=UPI000C240231|nr:hypothetical protein [Bacillus sp. FJAT-44742]
MKRAFIVNTNKSYNPTNEKEMLQEMKVAAYQSPWKYYISDIQAGDIVFLHSNTNGIIARGLATGEAKVKVTNGRESYHYMHLNEFEKVEQPVPARDVTYLARQVTDLYFRMRWYQAIMHVPHVVGEHIWEHITNHCMEKEGLMYFI